MHLPKIDFDLTQANCLDADPEIFFVDDRDEPEYDKRKTNVALQLCSSCPVKADCLQYALKEKAIGVWGGTTSIERALINDGRKNNKPTNLVERNNNRKVESGAIMSKSLIKAIELDDGSASVETIMMARLKIENPEMSYAEMAVKLGVTRSVIQNRLQRFVRRIDERVF